MGLANWKIPTQYWVECSHFWTCEPLSLGLINVCLQRCLDPTPLTKWHGRVLATRAGDLSPWLLPVTMETMYRCVVSLTPSYHLQHSLSSRPPPPWWRQSSNNCCHGNTLVTAVSMPHSILRLQGTRLPLAHNSQFLFTGIDRPTWEGNIPWNVNVVSWIPKR